MDVTSENFPTIRAQIETDIDACTFAAIDCEFTGLNLPRPLHPMDTTAERYEKLQQGLPNYAVIQIGLSLWHREGDSYTVKTYNIYTFPADNSFSCQSSSLSFLVKFGFDLNRCIRQGLPYRPLCDLTELRREQRKRHRRQLAKIIDPSCDSFEGLLDGKIHSLGDVLGPSIDPNVLPQLLVTEEEKQADSYVKSHLRQIHDWMTNQQESDLILPACNDIVRASFYPIIERTYRNVKFQMEAIRNENYDNRAMKKIKFSRHFSTPLELVLEKITSDFDKLDRSFGASVIVAKLSSSRKPVIVHNGIRDIMYLISHFLAPLPNSFKDFQPMCKELFPAILDTKFMATSQSLKKNLRHSGLKAVFDQVRFDSMTFATPKIQEAKESGYEVDEERAHEAGYDAWMTGNVFAGFLEYFNSELTEPCDIGVAHPTLGNFIHKLHFGPSLDISCFDLDLFSENLQRKSMYVLEWSHPEDGQPARQMIVKAGGSKRSVCVDGNRMAFVANSTSQCDKYLKTRSDKDTAVRFYKYSASGSGRRRKIRNAADSERSPDLIPRACSPSSVTSDEVELKKKPKLIQRSSTESISPKHQANKTPDVFTEVDW